MDNSQGGTQAPTNTQFSCTAETSESQVLLTTAQIQVSLPESRVVTLRTLLDTGAQCTFIS